MFVRVFSFYKLLFVILNTSEIISRIHRGKRIRFHPIVVLILVGFSGKTPIGTRRSLIKQNIMYLILLSWLWRNHEKAVKTKFTLSSSANGHSFHSFIKFVFAVDRHIYDFTKLNSNKYFFMQYYNGVSIGYAVYGIYFWLKLLFDLQKKKYVGV